jgi:hypothetical protein
MLRHTMPTEESSMRINAITIFVALFALVAPAGGAEYEPKVGQPGKDVIWVPTPQALVERMLDMARATPKDYVVDLGSGDGRTVITAAKRGIKALGIEYNPDMVALSRVNAERAGVSGLARFVHGDVFTTDFSDATVVTMYLLSSLNVKLRPTLLKMKPGTRIVSHAFDMGDWTPDETATVDGYNAYLWIVPTNARGLWQVSGQAGTFDLVLEQKYQKLTGKASGKGITPAVTDPLLEGDRIQFTLIDHSGRFLRFQGRVAGDAMEGKAQLPDGASVAWRARRTNG